MISMLTFTSAEKSVHLSPREIEVIHLLKQYPSESDKELAARLHISKYTYKAHIRHIYDRMGVSSRLECVLRSIELGIIL